jgi:hypothetical protein
MDEPRDEPPSKASFGATMKAVLWSFFGVRKKRDFEKDAQQLNPLHVIVAGLLAALLLVMTLILIARSVVG